MSGYKKYKKDDKNQRNAVDGSELFFLEHKK